MRCHIVYRFFFKQKTAYEMRISDWSSDVCSSDLADPATLEFAAKAGHGGESCVDRGGGLRREHHRGKGHRAGVESARFVAIDRHYMRLSGIRTGKDSVS